MSVVHRRDPGWQLVVAAAGYGKTAALEAGKPADGVILQAGVALERGLPAAPWIGLDDLHVLDHAEQVVLLRALVRERVDATVVITSRTVPLDEVLAAGGGPLRQRAADDLALDPAAVARVLVDEYGVTDPEEAVRVQRLTAGWPGLVHEVAGHLRPVVATEVAETLPTGWVDLLCLVADLGPLSSGTVTGLAEALGLDLLGVGLGTLARLGVVRPAAGRTGSALHEPVPALVSALPGPRRSWAAARLAAVARVYEESGASYAAAVALERAGDLDGVTRLLGAAGDDMLRSGQARGVLRLVAALPEPPITVRLLEVDALRTCGELTTARRAIDLVSRRCREPRAAGAVALRAAMVGYAASDLDGALAALTALTALTTLAALGESDGADSRRTRAATGPLDPVNVEREALRVHLLCGLGRRDEALATVPRLLTQAERSGDPRCLTSAHLAAARVCEGSRKEVHHEAALRSASSTGDVVSVARVLTNISCLHLAAGRFAQAEHVARCAVETGDRFDAGSGTGRHLAALHNLAEALTHLGRYDDARWHLERSIALGRHLGDGRMALGLLGIAETHRLQAHTETARRLYREAADLARDSGERQVLVPALAGLARVTAELSGDTTDDLLAEAGEFAEEALAAATADLVPRALTAAGWVALRTGHLGSALARAEAAVERARAVDALALLAEALELLAACTGDVGEARRHLTAALAVWEDGGAVPAVCRVRVRLGHLPGADSADRDTAREAAVLLRRWGVQVVTGLVGGGEERVSLAVLGTFRASVAGVDVPAAAWRSRHARTLVKVLVARRGRPVSRAWLCETLWPDDDPARTGHRLSVLLATVRGVLDPGRRWPADRYVAGDHRGLWLEPQHVAVDAYVLLEDADHAAALASSAAGPHEVVAATRALDAVDRGYVGDAFEDEPDEAWADPLRESVRAAWIATVRLLATLRTRQGQPSQSHALLQRLLVVDPLDEQVHRLLVRSLCRTGRHGEARRAFDRWAGVMADLDAPAPDPRVLEVGPGGPSIPAGTPAAAGAPVVIRR